MTSSPAPHDFDALRRSAIGYAQAASGNIWTDYNLHDPGVTLLEQTCYALSEMSFQATHTTPDLLTGGHGDIRFEDLSLFLPEDVLPGAPVTLLDLAAELSEAPGIARVLVSRGQRAGLLDAVIIPARDISDAEANEVQARAKETVRQVFNTCRPLGCDLNLLQVAQHAPARLSGDVKISGTAIPERVAAEIYFHVSAILRGQAVGSKDTVGATRQTVYDHPQAYLHAPSDQNGKVPDLEDHLAAFRDIPGVVDISSFSLSRQPFSAPPVEARDSIHYLDLALPETLADIELELSLNGVPLKLDPSQILEEFVRVSADHLTRAKHHLDANDWVPPSRGQRRQFDLAPVDALLPNVYAANAKGSAEAGLLTRYRSAVNAHLENMSATLRDLPTFLTATTDAASADPALQRQRVDLLNFLIAHQGAEMPATLHAGLHVYRSASERAFFDIRWRLDFLAALPYFNSRRGVGPDGNVPGAFLAQFRLLADLEHHHSLAHMPERLQVSLVSEINGDEPDFSRNDLRLPENPFDMLIPYDPDAQLLSDDDLMKASPWVSQGTCYSDFFNRSADPKSFLVSETADGGFVVLFDAGHATHLYTCATFATGQVAKTFTQRLRASWKALHATAEGAYLIEDILLRNAGSDFIPNTAKIVLTGWTARTCQPTYRAYVEQLIETLAPAHLKIEPRWLCLDDMVQFETLYEGYLKGEADAKRDLRALLVNRKTAS